MKTHPTTPRTEYHWPASWIAALALGVLIGACWPMLNLPSVWAVLLAGTALAASMVFLACRQQSSWRARRREAALDVFVQRELARTVTR